MLQRDWDGVTAEQDWARGRPHSTAVPELDLRASRAANRNGHAGGPALLLNHLPTLTVQRTNVGPSQQPGSYERL